jgi:putative transposase
VEARGRLPPPIEDLEVIRTEAGMPITRFAELIGMPRRTYTRRRSRWLKGDPVKGPWPAPVVEAIEPTVAKLAEAWPAWGHRKIHAMHRLDHPQLPASASSVERAMRRRGLLQPIDYQAERRQHAQARREAFVEPPTHRNQVWQLDFSEFETLGGGTWRIAGCADYFAKHEFGWRVSVTENRHDAIAAIEQAIGEVEALLGHSLLRDVTDADGIVHPVKVVTDNGPAFKAIGFARFIDSRPELVHIRTRRKSPHTNGVRERAFGSLKYEHLYREEITDGVMLADQAEHYRQIFNTIRPHEALEMRRPTDVYLTAVPNFEDPEPEPPS